MLCSFSLEPYQATWILINTVMINTRFLEDATQRHQQLKLFPKHGLRCLPNSSCVSFQHCEGDTPHWSDLLTRMEIVKRMVLSQWSLADACMCALSSVLVIDMSWIATWTPDQLARLTKHWTSTSNTSAYILPAWQNLFNAVLILARTGKGNLILDKYEIPGRRHAEASANKAVPNTRSEVSAKLKLFQFSTLRSMESVQRMVLSQWSLADACMCAFSSVLVIDMKWIAERTPHQLARLAPVTQVLIFFQRGKTCSMLCSFLLWTGTGNMIPGSDRISGSRHTAAATKQSAQKKVWGVCQTPAFSALHIAKQTLFMETRKKMVLSQWSFDDTCMRAFTLCSMLVIDVNCLAACM